MTSGRGILAVLTILFLCVTEIITKERLPEYSECRPKGASVNSRWQCLRFSQCSDATARVKKGQRPEICDFAGQEPIICCEVKGEDKNQGIKIKDSPTTPSVKLEITSKAPAVVSKNSLNSLNTIKKKCKEYAEAVYSPPVVLLPKSAAEEKIDNCHSQASVLVVDGVDADPKEFPHMKRRVVRDLPAYRRGRRRGKRRHGKK